MNQLPLISTPVLPVTAYIESPRIDLLVEHFGPYLEGITKEDKWLLVEAIARTLRHRLNCHLNPDSQELSVRTLWQDFTMGSTYSVDLLKIVNQMRHDELRLFAEFLVCDVVNTEILSPTDPRFIDSYEHYSAS